MTVNTTAREQRSRRETSSGRTGTFCLQRACACGGSSSPSGACPRCRGIRPDEQSRDELRGVRNRRPGVRLHRSASATALQAVAPPIVHQVIRRSGAPLDESTRVSMEAHLGHDFRRVRVHHDRQAASSARAVRAAAYTVGHHVVFGHRRFAPQTAAGQRLLAHELVHVAQQPSGTPPRRLPIAAAGDVHEREASRIAGSLMVSGHRASAAAGENAETPNARLSRAPVGVCRTPERTDCTPTLTGFPPSVGNCAAYAANSWWLPWAYVNNATCACTSTPDSPTANCVRAFLQRRLAAAPRAIKIAAAMQKSNDVPNAPQYAAYQAFVQTLLTPLIYRDHVDAYQQCCCPCGPAPYPAWIGVTTAPIQPCSLVGYFIRQFGSCHCTPGAW